MLEIQTKTKGNIVIIEITGDVDLYSSPQVRKTILDLVNKNIANEFLPRLKVGLKEVELRGCDKTCDILSDEKKAVEDDWTAEFLDLILAVKVVDDLDDAINHINK